MNNSRNIPTPFGPVHVSITPYFHSHFQQPYGRGRWGFAPADDRNYASVIWIDGNKTFTVARIQAAMIAGMMNVRNLVVLP